MPTRNREIETTAQIRQQREIIERAEREIARLEVKSSLCLATLVLLEEDPDGTQGLDRRALLQYMMDELGDFPPFELRAAVRAAVKKREIERAGRKLYVTHRTFRALGLD